jgi:hypothetical protein
MVNYISIGNYAILNENDIRIKNSDGPPFRGFWEIIFDGSSFKAGLRACVILIFVGSSSKAGSTACVILKNLQGELHPLSLQFQFQCKNNETEYEEIIQGLILHHGWK